MSKLIKQILKEDEAVKFSYNSGDYDFASKPAIDIYTYGDSVNFRLNKLPTELKLKLTKEGKDASDFRYDVIDAVRAPLKQLSAQNPKFAAQLNSELMDELIKMKEEGGSHKKSLLDEYDRIFAHLREMLRASIIEYQHDTEEYFQSKSEELKQTYLEKIESALKASPEK